MTLCFKDEPSVELRIVDVCDNDLYLLAALHLYVRMVRAGVVKPLDFKPSEAGRASTS